MDAPPPVSADDFAATPPSVLALIQWQARQIAQLPTRSRRAEGPTRQGLDQLVPAALGHSSARQAAHAEAQVEAPPRRPTRTRQARTGVDPRRALPGRRALRSHGLPPLRPGAPRHRPRTAAAPGLGTARDPARRHRVSAASARLCVRLLHLRRAAGGRADRPGRAAADRLRRPAHGLLPPVQAAGRPVPGHDPQPAGQRRLDGALAEPLCRGRAAGLRRTRRDNCPTEPVSEHRRVADQGRPAKAWVWTFVADTFTFFACRTSRAADVLEDLLGDNFAGVIHCDRAKMYWRFGRLQWCWAHLKRDFQALIDNPCQTRKRLGHDLMRPTKELFALWKRVRDGTLPAPRLRPTHATDPRRGGRAAAARLLQRADRAASARNCGEHRERLWTFVEVDGVEPTNNAAERAPAARRHLAEAVVRHPVGGGQPVRRADADRDRDLPPRRPQRLRLADRRRARPPPPPIASSLLARV